MLNIINNIPNKYNSVMIAGHNPTFHYLSQLLSNETISEFPTCSMFSLEFDVDSWNEVDRGKKQFMIYPKLFKNSLNN